jgi:RNA polymerase sigma-70 factor (ECF subfamily)
VYNSIESDEVLIERIKKGDVEAFNPLVERYKLPLYKVMYRMVYSQDDAEDLVEEAFIRAYKAIKRFELGRSFFSWLCRIAVNNAINFMKRERRGQMQPLETVEYSLTAKKGNPVEMTKEKMLQEKVARAMSRLPDEFRTILVLRVEEEFSYEQISTILRIPKGTVMSRLARARQKLRDLFSEMGVK